jgi:hypothetical protein
VPAQQMEKPITVVEAVLAIRSSDYVLPNIQRDLVWSTEATEKLFDSLMRVYPIGTFLFWRVDEKNSKKFSFFEFMRSYHALTDKTLKPYEAAVPKTLTAVLDGQQRLSSFAIGILGFRADKLKNKSAAKPENYPKKRLYLNIAKKLDPGDDLGRIYDFRFLTDDIAAERTGDAHWFALKHVLEFRTPGGEMDVERVWDWGVKNHVTTANLGILFRLATALLKDPVIHYFREDEQSLNRVLDIFVRLNDGGTKLSYSDLLLSIASAQWKTNAREAIIGLVDAINSVGDGFRFDKDFVLKSALVLSDISDVGFSVDNFTRENTEVIERGWADNVQAPLMLAVNLAATFGYNRDNLEAATVVVPVAYYLKKLGSPSNFLSSEKYASDRHALRLWMVLAQLKHVFAAKTDTLLASIRSVLKTHDEGGFPLHAVAAALAAHGKPLRFSMQDIDDLLSAEYGRRGTFSILAALTPSLNMQFKYHQDHLFPKSGFHRTKLKQAGFDDAAIEAMTSKMNQLPNLQLLEGLSNTEKLAAPYEQWISSWRSDPARWASYCEHHAIPALPSYSLADFETFFDERKKLLRARLSAVLTFEDAVPPAIASAGAESAGSTA